MKKLSDLSDELDAWSNSLAPHLKLQFAQDKPSTGTISSRSPLLSLTFHYIRALIQRPAVSASLGSRSSSSMITLASSSKHVVQLVELLEERSMSFAFCLNKDELLVLSGFGLLFQGIGLDSSSKILRDNQKTISRIVAVLEKSKAPCASEFKRAALSFLPIPTAPAPQPTPASNTAPPKPTMSAPPPKKTVPLSRHNSDPAITINPLPSLPASTRKQLKAIASRFSTGASSSRPPKLDLSQDIRRATVHSISLHPQGVPTQSQPSLSPSRYDPASMSRSEPSRSPDQRYGRPTSAVVRPSAPPQLQPAADTAPRPHQQQQQPPQPKQKPINHKLPNLDYLSFGPEPDDSSRPAAQPPIKTEPEPTDWEKLLGSLDNGATNIYDACYGGQPIEALLDNSPSIVDTETTPAISVVNAMPGAWDEGGDLWALCQTDSHSSEELTTSTGSQGVAGSVFSFTSGDDEGRRSSDGLEWVDGPYAGDGDVYKGFCIPADIVGGTGEDAGQFAAAWEGALNL